MVSAEAAGCPTDISEPARAESIKTALPVLFARNQASPGFDDAQSQAQAVTAGGESTRHRHLIGVMIAQRSSQRALRERVKQLTYLYRIAELFARPDTRVEEITQQSPQLIAHGCPVPGPVTARVRVGELEGWWPKRTACAAGLASEIVIQGRVRGRVEVRCGDWRPEHAEEWERDEAQRFLDAVAGALATALHRSELRSERDALQAQVQHAERMATIGTLMAVLAHEVSSPLVSIHGFAELMQSDPSISGSARADLDRIRRVAPREGAVRNYSLFQRFGPSWQPTNLNHAVEDAFLSSNRSAREGA
jgi:signal transduction histidine kinase